MKCTKAVKGKTTSSKKVIRLPAKWDAADKRMYNKARANGKSHTWAVKSVNSYKGEGH